MDRPHHVVHRADQNLLRDRIWLDGVVALASWSCGIDAAQHGDEYGGLDDRNGADKSIARIAMPSMMVLHRERAVDRGQFDPCEIDDDGLKPCAARGQATLPAAADDAATIATATKLNTQHSAFRDIRQKSGSEAPLTREGKCPA